MPVTNISLLRKNLFNTIDTVIKYDDPVTVSTKNGNAVIISQEEYDSMKETIYLLSQPGLLDRVKEGEKENIEDMKTFDPNEEW